MDDARALLWEPAGIFPGHQARQGTRCPPSKTVPLPARSFPAEPPCSPYQGALVELAIAQALENLADAPVDLADNVAIESAFCFADEVLGGKQGHVRLGVSQVDEEGIVDILVDEAEGPLRETFGERGLILGRQG
jgi:hypothetical protein